MITKEDILKVFKKQLGQIKDKELRDKVIETWVEGCRRGKWDSIEQLEKVPFSLLTDAKGISLIEHTIAVTEGAVGLAKAQKETYKKMPYKINFDYLYAGGLLHDVGKLMEIEPKAGGGYCKSKSGRYTRHPISGAILAGEIGLPQEIINIIACHSKEGEGAPLTVETILIHQADFAVFDPIKMLEKGSLII